MDCRVSTLRVGPAMTRRDMTTPRDHDNPSVTIHIAHCKNEFAIMTQRRFTHRASHIFGAVRPSMCRVLFIAPLLGQAIMSRTSLMFASVAALAAALAVSSTALAQSGGYDLELRIEQLENRLRQLTGQNEELQYRNRQLEDQLRAAPGGQGGAPPPAQPQANYQPPPQQPAYPQQQPDYRQAAPQQPAYPPQQTYQQQPQPQPTYQQPAQEQAAAPPPARGRRGDAFDPNANPGAPGAPRPLGSISGPSTPPQPQNNVGAPGGRSYGEPLDLSNSGRQGNAAPPAGPVTGSLATAPPSATPRDEFDLGYGYIQRKDYALAEETLRDFVRKYPSDALVSDAQYWLGESLYQRQRYRDAAEAFLTVTTKFETSSKAPDSLLRLGQSLAALKEKEAACAAFGEVTRKYPRASSGVKQAIDREQKRVKC
jgi:tol-pal system protein YbgF